MKVGFRKAIGVGFVAGIIVIIIEIALYVMGILFDLVVPGIFCLFQMAGWIVVPLFMVAVGWYTARQTADADHTQPVLAAGVAGVCAGLVSQSINMLVGVLIVVIAMGYGAFLAFFLSLNLVEMLLPLTIILGDTGLKDLVEMIKNIVIVGGVGLMLLCLVIVVVCILIWLLICFIFSVAGGIIHGRRAPGLVKKDEVIVLKD